MIASVDSTSYFKIIKNITYDVSKILKTSFLFDYHMKGKPIHFDGFKLFKT